MRRRYDKLKFIEYLEEFPYISYAAKKSGISRATIYRWMKDDKDFREALNKALALGYANISDVAEMSLVSLIKNKNLGAIKFYLENNDPKYKKPTSMLMEKVEKLKLNNQEIEEFRKYKEDLKRVGDMTPAEIGTMLKEQGQEVIELGDSLLKTNSFLGETDRLLNKFYKENAE